MTVAPVSPGVADGTLPHRSGHTVYARVERPDGTHRAMLVDNVSRDAMRRGTVAADLRILMESFAGDRLTSVFVKRRQRGEWVYGAIRPGETVEAFRPGPHCAACHRDASDRDGMFTQDMLRAFVAEGRMQVAFCDLPGRSPCEREVYGRR